MAARVPLDWGPELSRLRAVVDGSGMSQAEVAEAAGMRPQALSRILLGQLDPSISRVARVLAAAGGSWADLDP